MQAHDVSDDALLRKASSGATRVLAYLSQWRKWPAGTSALPEGGDLRELHSAIASLEHLLEVLTKEPRS